MGALIDQRYQTTIANYGRLQGLDIHVVPVLDDRYSGMTEPYIEDLRTTGSYSLRPINVTLLPQQVVIDIHEQEPITLTPEMLQGRVLNAPEYSHLTIEIPGMEGTIKAQQISWERAAQAETKSSSAMKRPPSQPKTDLLADLLQPIPWSGVRPPSVSPLGEEPTPKEPPPEAVQAQAPVNVEEPATAAPQYEPVEETEDLAAAPTRHEPAGGIEELPAPEKAQAEAEELAAAPTRREPVDGIEELLTPEKAQAEVEELAAAPTRHEPAGGIEDLPAPEKAQEVEELTVAPTRHEPAGGIEELLTPKHAQAEVEELPVAPTRHEPVDGIEEWLTPEKAQAEVEELAAAPTRHEPAGGIEDLPTGEQAEAEVEESSVERARGQSVTEIEGAAAVLQDHPSTVTARAPVVRPAQSLPTREEANSPISQSPLEAVEHLFVAIRHADHNSATRLALQLLQRLKEACGTPETILGSVLSVEAKVQATERLFTVCKNQRLLGNRELCWDLVMVLIELGKFADAQQALAENTALYTDVALEMSEKTPGLALHALNRALELDKELPYSEKHIQILANITQQVARYSPRMGSRIWLQAIELAQQQAPTKAFAVRKRLFYQQTQPQLHELVADPARVRVDEDGFEPIGVRVRLGADYETFGDKEEKVFLEGLAEMLRVLPDDIFVLSKSRGSVVYRLYFRLPIACYTLKRKFELWDEDIQALHLRWKQQLREVRSNLSDIIIKSVDIILVTVVERTSALRSRLFKPDGQVTVVQITLFEKVKGASAVVCVGGPLNPTVVGDITLPFDQKQLTTILKVLEERSLDNVDVWQPPQIETLCRLGLFDYKLASGILANIRLYLKTTIASGNLKRILAIVQPYRWHTILKALTCRLATWRWTSEEEAMLWDMKLIEGVGLTNDYLEKIGDAVYNEALAADKDVYSCLESTLKHAPSEAVVWQLEVRQSDTDLARYPWELANNRGRFLLLNEELDHDLARSILSCGPPRPLEVVLPLNVLYIESRPITRNGLRDEERSAVLRALEKLRRDGLVNLTVLSTSPGSHAESPPTYAAVVDHRATQSRGYHILHFDGHGVFGRQCPKCGKFYHPHYVYCVKGCKTRLDEPRGFLQFEDLFRRPEWVNSDDLYYLLDAESLRLVVLSACFSAAVYGETVFSGVAPALLQRGVPCTVGMQFSFLEDDARMFTDAFYRSLADSGNVRKAVQAGRQELKRGKSWFVPALYLRTEDAKGQLFRPVSRRRS